jgi:hypothetical protein
MQIRPDRGWIKAGLAVLVAGVLGGGVMGATGVGWRGPKKVTADGVSGKALPAAADKSLDLAAGPEGATEDPKPDPLVGDKIKVGSDGGSVTVSAVEDSVSAGRLFGAGEGRKYIAVEVKGCSGPHEKNLTFEPGYFLLRLDDGTVHDPGPGAKKPSLDGGSMPPGKCLSGWVTFTVREGALATAVIYDGSRRLTWTVPPPKGAKPTTTTGKPAAAATSDDPATTTSTKPKTTAKPTPTTARSTATTSKPTTTTRKASATSTTTKPGPTTSTTAKSGSSSTTSPSSGKSAGTTTTTTGKSTSPVAPSPPTTPTT